MVLPIDESVVVDTLAIVFFAEVAFHENDFIVLRLDCLNGSCGRCFSSGVQHRSTETQRRPASMMVSCGPSLYLGFVAGYSAFMLLEIFSNVSLSGI
jgi:hypothetical protein